MNQVDGSHVSADLFKNDANAQAHIKESVHNVLYALSRSNLMNRYNATTRIKQNMTWWRGVYMAIDIVAGVALAACLTLYILAARTQEGE